MCPSWNLLPQINKNCAKSIDIKTLSKQPKHENQMIEYPTQSFVEIIYNFQKKKNPLQIWHDE
jgi:hypothetical protein